MLIDGVNISTFGGVVQDRRNSRKAVRVKQNVQGAPGAWRSVRLGQAAPDSLLLTCRGFLEGTSLSDVQDKLDELKWRIPPNQEVAIRWSDTPDREWVGYRESIDVTDIPPGWVRPYVRFTINVLCADPRARDLSDTVATDNGAPPSTIEINIGTAPHPVLIEITGSSSNLVNPVVKYRNSANVAVKQFQITDTLTGSDTYTIDSETFVIDKNGTNGGGNLSGDLFDVDPIDGDFLTPSTPDIRLEASGGSADLFRVTYRKRFW